MCVAGWMLNRRGIALLLASIFVMLAVAQSGSAAEITVVALPCAWIYCVVGRHLLRNGPPPKRHPYRDWLMTGAVLYLFLLLLIMGSFACIQVLADSLKNREYKYLVQMLLVEVFVMTFEVMRAETRLYPAFVLASLNASTYHTSYASAFRLLRPCRTTFLKLRL